MVVKTLQQCKGECEKDEFCVHITHWFRVLSDKTTEQICDLRSFGCYCSQTTYQKGSTTHLLIRNEPRVIPIEGNKICDIERPQHSFYFGYMTTIECYDLCVKKSCKSITITGSIDDPYCQVFAKCDKIVDVDERSLTFTSYNPQIPYSSPQFRKCPRAKVIETRTPKFSLKKKRTQLNKVIVTRTPKENTHTTKVIETRVGENTDSSDKSENVYPSDAKGNKNLTESTEKTNEHQMNAIHTPLSIGRNFVPVVGVLFDNLRYKMIRTRPKFCRSQWRGWGFSFSSNRVTIKDASSVCVVGILLVTASLLTLLTVSTCLVLGLYFLLKKGRHTETMYIFFASFLYIYLWLAFFRASRSWNTRRDTPFAFY